MGGVLGQLFWNWKAESTPVFAGLSVWAGIAPVLWIINANVSKAPLFILYFVSIFAGIVASIAGMCPHNVACRAVASLGVHSFATVAARSPGHPLLTISSARACRCQRAPNFIERE
jgi:hypothetical protein